MLQNCYANVYGLKKRGKNLLAITICDARAQWIWDSIPGSIIDSEVETWIVAGAGLFSCVNRGKAQCALTLQAWAPSSWQKFKGQFDASDLVLTQLKLLLRVTGFGCQGRLSLVIGGE